MTVDSFRWTNDYVVATYKMTTTVAYESDTGSLICSDCAGCRPNERNLELAPVRVGELLGCDTPDPVDWVCHDCGLNVLNVNRK